MLSSIKHSSKDKEIVERHVNLFNTMMGALNSGKAIKSYSDLQAYISMCDTMIQNIGSDINSVSSSEAKDILNKLKGNIMQVQSQLKSHA